jgi:PAS domain S-box-containing protein
LLTKTGLKLIAWHNTILRDDDGFIEGTLSSGEDITDRRRAENALLESENKFRSITEQIGDVIFITDSEGAVTYISPASEKMFGCLPEDMTGRHFSEFLDPSSVDTCLNAFTSAIENRHDTRNLELLIKRGNGTLFYGELSGTRYVLGTATGTLGVIRDISDKKQAEEEKKKLEQQIQHAQKLESLGVLAGGIAHDFNNILMVILGHADLAMEDTSTISPARKSLGEIVTASRRAAELCNQMLAYSGRASFVIERINLGTVIEEMAHLLKSSINKKAIFNMNITRDIPSIEADPSQIRQIAMNLIINASDAIGDRSGIITLTVAATRFEEDYLKETEIDSNLLAGLYVYLEVADTGSGMDEETRERLFEPFFTTKFTGRGLGLAAVLGIVRAHRGAIKVYSEKGKGTTFKVLIPAAEDTRDELKSAENGAALAEWKGSGTILIADDDDSVRALCARMLERLGFTVITAADGSVALDVYRQRRNDIDLVILDLTMPRMDGVEAFSALRRENSELKIVLASGYSEEDVASRVAGKGLSGVIQKPYTISKLKELLSGIM